MIDILIFNYGDGLVDMTVSSIKKNMPDWNYHVINVVAKNKTLFYAFNYSKKIKKPVLAVSEGIVLNIKSDDIPAEIEKYPMVVSREAVFSKNNRYHSDYEQIDYDIAGRIDLSIFIINYKKFDFYPTKNKGVLSKITLGYMPRKMNFTTDILFTTTMNPYNCLKYGIDSKDASVVNYVRLLYKKELKLNELLAYDFDLIRPYIQDIRNNNLRSNLIRHIQRTRKNYIHKLRSRMQQVEPSRFSNFW